MALIQIAVALPALLLGEAGSSVHASRHLGSFSVAVAVVLLFVAWRPSLASGLLPMVAAFVVCSAGATFADVIGGRTSLAAELIHVPEAAGLVLLLLVVASWRALRDRHRGLVPA